MHLIATTWYDSAFAPLGDLARAALQRYCRRHGYELCLPEVPQSGRPLPWHKIEILRSLRARGADLLLWVDADAMIVRPECPVHEALPPDRDVGLAKHVIHGVTVPNTGILVLRAGEIMDEFLEEIWRREEYLDHPWWENAAAIDLLGYHGAFADGRENAPDPHWERRIHWLDPAWNALPEITSTDGAIIRHYAGREFSYRLEHMQEDARGLEAAGPAWDRLLRWFRSPRRAPSTP